MSRRGTMGLLLVLAGACADAPPPGLGPAMAAIELPKALREVSGMVAHGEQFLCVQDERGQLYVVDRDGTIQEQRKFGPKGDYEDLAVVGDELFVLRSDGALLRRPLGGGETGPSYQLGSPDFEYESLAYDQHRHRLLLTAKATRLPHVGPEPVRAVLAFELTRGEPAATPAVELSLVAFAQAAAAVGHRGRFGLRIGALAVDPDGELLWVLAGPDGMLFAMAWSGAVRGAWRLDLRLLPQAEGLCFDATGRLWIASEAAGGTARLVAYTRPALPR